MKFVLIVFIFLISFVKINFSQETKQDLQLFDSVTVFNCEELLSRLDGFIIKIGQNPNSEGFVVIYDNNNPIDNKFLERYIRSYQEFRKIDKNRFKILTSKPVQGKRIEFWLSQNETILPNIKEVNFSFALPKAEKPILFVRDWIVIENVDGKLTYFGDCAACCIERIDLDFLSKFLESNLQLSAHIKIYGKSRFYTRKLEKLIRNDLINEYKISPKRFRISYQGIDAGIAQLPKNNATIEIEFILQR